MFGAQPLAAQSLRRIHQVSPRASLPRSGFVHEVGSRRLLVFKFYRAVAWNRRFRMPVGGCAVIGGNVAL
ncbi:hypothetical protein SAMN04487974_1043 [Pelagibacterium luteolum]|uniref:Uncharacterized protein n=1 Tax=Pelagibacterium luteolum TaxID=440168 RepID=A0A1G7V9I3_9HYPH|nr:hypothetical protein SAMN04487974_1043 [Pelagibacterium luteolum]